MFFVRGENVSKEVICEEWASDVWRRWLPWLLAIKRRFVIIFKFCTVSNLMDLFVEEEEAGGRMDMIDGAGDGQRDVVNEDGEVAAETRQKRGVKRGTKRGPYRKRNEDARLRIIESYRKGEDWKATAVANGVAVKTAYGYICKPEEDTARRRGGATYREVTSAHVRKLVGYVEENPQVSLKEMAQKLKQDTGLELSIPTVHRHLHGQMYTGADPEGGCRG